MKKPLSSLLLLFFMVSLTCTFKENLINITLPEIIVKASSQNTIRFTKDNISTELPEYVLVAITNHECYHDANITERIFMMEAVWNRVMYNFNGNGITLTQQLLAKDQFSGLFLYNKDKFSLDIQKDRYLISLAREIIYNHKRIYPVKLFYWTGFDKNSHRKWVLQRKLKTIIKTSNIFA